MNQTALDFPRYRRRPVSTVPHHRQAAGSLLVTTATAALASVGVCALAIGGNTLLFMVGALILGIAGLVGAVHT